MLTSQTTRMATAALCGAILIAVLGATTGASAQPQFPDDVKARAHAGNMQCKICHNNPKEGGQWDNWKKSKHAGALELLKTDAAKEVATKAGVTGPPDQAPQCLKCHVTGYDEAKAAAPEKINPADGVQCESCHGPAGDHLKDAKVLKMAPDKLGEIDVMAHLVTATEANCRGCHNDSSPSWKNDRYTLESGEKVGFDFKQAWAKINHEFPAGVMETKYGGKYPSDTVGAAK